MFLPLPNIMGRAWPFSSTEIGIQGSVCVFLFLSLSALIREAAKKGIKIGTKRNKTKIYTLRKTKEVQNGNSFQSKPTTNEIHSFWKRTQGKENPFSLETEQNQNLVSWKTKQNRQSLKKKIKKNLYSLKNNKKSTLPGKQNKQNPILSEKQ